jgi:hypothetical protein
MRLSGKLYQATVAALGFACCWLLYFMLLAGNLPMLLKFFHSVDLEGGWTVVLQQEHGWKVVGLSVVVVIAGNVAWLVSKIFERRFVEVWTKK